MSNIFDEIVKTNISSPLTLIKELDIKGEPLPFEEANIKKIELIKEMSGYPIIDLSFLKMMNQDGYPRFAVFGQVDPYFRINISVLDGEVDTITSNVNTKVIMRHYVPFLKSFLKLKQNKRNSHIIHTIYSSFEGILTNEAREIMSAKADWNKLKGNLSGVFLIAEATNWKYEKEEIKLPVPTDPLIVKIDYTTGIAYLLHKFNMTRVEDYISKEFCVENKQL